MSLDENSVILITSIGKESKTLCYVIDILEKEIGKVREVVILYPKTIENSDVVKAYNEVSQILALRQIRVYRIDVNPYNFVDLVTRVRSIVREKYKEFGENYKIILNLTAGRRSVGFALFCVAMLEADKVFQCVYLKEETTKLMEIPFIKLDISLTESEKKVLSEIMNIVNNRGVSKIKENEVTKRVVGTNIYRIMSRLKEKGIIKNVKREGKTWVIKVSDFVRFINI